MIRKIIATLLLFCLYCSQAWGVIFVGTVASGTCDTSNDGQLVAFGTGTGAVNYPVSTTTWRAMVFAGPSSSWDLTEYSLYIYDDGNGTATFTVSLYDTNASHQPTTEISGTLTTVTGVPNSFTETTIPLASVKTGLSSSEEFAVVVKCSNSNCAWKRTSDTGGITDGYIVNTEDSGSTWDTPASAYSFVGNGVYGCN